MLRSVHVGPRSIVNSVKMVWRHTGTAAALTSAGTSKSPSGRI